MEGKSSTQRVRFLTPCLPIDDVRFSTTNPTISERENIFYAKL